MFAKAEADVNKLVAELGESAPMKMPETAYFLSCIYAYIGKKVTTVGELKEALTDVKAMMTREYKTKDIFTSGVGTAIAAEMIEACKYVKTQTPYEGTNYHGHFTDAEVRELGVPLVTGDIPGFVVMIGPAPSTEEAVETISKAGLELPPVPAVSNQLADAAVQLVDNGFFFLARVCIFQMWRTMGNDELGSLSRSLG